VSELFLFCFLLLKSPSVGEGWIVSVDDLDDTFGEHVWLGFICVFDGI
jgi:photosystem II CP43 chlorophyll apoprotein